MTRTETYAKLEKIEMTFSEQEVLSALLKSQDLPLYEDGRETTIELWEESSPGSSYAIVTLEYTKQQEVKHE